MRYIAVLFFVVELFVLVASHYSWIYLKSGFLEDLIFICFNVYWMIWCIYIICSPDCNFSGLALLRRAWSLATRHMLTSANKSKDIVNWETIIIDLKSSVGRALVRLSRCHRFESCFSHLLHLFTTVLRFNIMKSNWNHTSIAMQARCTSLTPLPPHWPSPLSSHCLISSLPLGIDPPHLVCLQEGSYYKGISLHLHHWSPPNPRIYQVNVSSPKWDL